MGVKEIDKSFRLFEFGSLDDCASKHTGQRVKVELLNWLCSDIIEAIHDLDHATHHFTENKTKETFKQFWLRLEQIEKRHRERFEGEPEYEEWDLKRLLGK